MDWFLSQEGEVGGYTKALWSGNTTLEWAKKCFDLIFYWDDYKTENILEGECLSKFDLLNLIKEIFKKDIKINPNDSVVLNKCLKGDIQTSNIKTQLKELKEYYF
jgi:dTDP-4-dehydrorhamnose reductase